MNTPIESAEHAAAAGPALQAVETFIIAAVQWLKLGVEVIGAALVAIGVVLAAVQFVRVMISRGTTGFTPIRLTLARYLALALEFQLGADILSFPGSSLGT